MAGTNWQQLSGGSTNPWTIRRDDGTPTANYSDHIICDGGTVTLPPPQANEAVLVSNVSAVTEIVPNGTETIEGEPSVFYDKNNPIAFVSDGVDWYVANDLGLLRPDSGVLDDFESGNLDAYTGNKNTWQISTGTVYEGDYSALGDGDGGAIIRDDVTVYQTQIIEARIYSDEANSGSGFVVGASGTDVSDMNGYSLAHQTEGSSNSVSLRRWDDGEQTVLSSTGTSPPKGEWMRAELEWYDNGDLVYTLEDASGNQIEQLTANDTTYEYGGIGFVKSGISGQRLWVDNAEVIGRTS